MVLGTVENSARSVNLHLKVCWFFVQEEMLFEVCCEWFIWFSTLSMYKLSLPTSDLPKKKTTLLLKSEKKLFYIDALLAKNHSRYSSCTASSYNAGGLIINPHRRGSFNLLCLLGRMSKNYRTASHFMSGSLMTCVDITFWKLYQQYTKCHLST